MVGGTGEIHQATEETQKLIETVKGDVEKVVGNSLATYKAISFISQVLFLLILH